LRTPFGGQHPGTDLPRRLVPHVLRVAAFEIRDPVACVVLSKSRNPLQRRLAIHDYRS
jgi:hypothetical protein